MANKTISEREIVLAVLLEITEKGGYSHLVLRDTLEKYQIIKEAKLYRDELAIAALEQTTSRILAAQAADELLNISGITASFVLYPDGDVTIISARSIGSANVQMILEPLGGGGNAATAGAQMQGVSVKDALDKLIASIDAFYEE